jgi:PAS domain S-box-containing protein
VDERDRRIAELERELSALRAEPAPASVGQGIVDRLLGDRALLANLPDVITILDRAHRVLYLNRVVRGRTIDEFLGQTLLGFVHASSVGALERALERAWATGEIQHVETRSVRDYWWESRVVPIVEDGRTVAMLSTAVDITERKRAEAALRASERRLRHAIEATGMGTWSVGLEGRGVVVDEPLCRILGVLPEDAPKTAEAFIPHIHPDDRALFVAALERVPLTGVFEELECRIVRPDGAIRHVLTKGMLVHDDAGHVLGSYGGVFDVTEPKRLEAQLRQVQKMEAVGQLTAGIAHNFNNILTIILPNAELSRREASPAIRRRLEAILHAGERGAEMVRQLLLFARGDARVLKAPIDLTSCLRRTAAMCRSTFGSAIEVELTVEPGLPSVVANAGQVEQVLLNVCLNARDALVEARPARPRIELSLGRSPDGGLRIGVRDNGAGMDEATCARVFEPFFTTKPVDRGTGLGLASAYAIVTEHRGRIRCRSAVGQGTTFEIDLPSVADAAVSAEGARS